MPDKLVEPLLVEALSDNRNWSPELPSAHGGSVTLKETNISDEFILADPVSGLGISQKVVPTEIEISKFGQFKPKDSKKEWTLSLHNESGTKLESETRYEQFAPAQFFKKSDQEKVNGKSFERLKSGIKARSGSELSSSRFRERPVEYEETIYDGDSKEKAPLKKGLSKDTFGQRLRGSAIARSPLSVGTLSVIGPEKVSFQAPIYAVVSRGDQSIYQEIGTGSSIEAVIAMRGVLADEPSLIDHLQVMPVTDLINP